MLRAVLFDVDGTLAETEEFHRRAFNAAFRLHAIDENWSVEQYRELLRVTGGKERLAAHFATRGAPLAAETIAALHGTKTRLYSRAMLDGSVGLRPGVRRLLDGARRQGVLLGLATTTHEANIDALLAPLLASNWRERFACIVAGDDIVCKKPAPDVYLECLSRLRLAREEVVAIEDSNAGVRAARAAGVPVIATPSVYCSGDDLTGAQWVLPHLGDPRTPWERDHYGCPQRWLEFSDLARLVEGRRLEAA